MVKKGKQIEFKVGNRVTEIKTGEKGTISRFCSDKGAVYVRWDKDHSQGMVDTKALIKGG